MLVTSIYFSKMFSTLAQKNLIIDLATFIKSHANVTNLEKSKYMFTDYMVFQQYFKYIAAASAPIHAFLEFFQSVLRTIFFPK